MSAPTLRKVEPQYEDGALIWEHYRAVTPADVRVWLLDQGATEHQWCEVHESTGDGFCRFVDGHMIGRPDFEPPPTECRMVSVLVWPAP